MIKSDKTSWNPDDFGETPRKVEENGQGTIFYDDSIEPPDPDDYPDIPTYEKAHDEWEANQVKWTDWTWLDGKLVRFNHLDLSQVQECRDRSVLESRLESLEQIREEYLDKANTVSKSRQNEFMRAVRDKDEQINWVKTQLKLMGENLSSTPPDSEFEATLTSNSPPAQNGVNGEIIHLDLEEVRRDGGTQPRAKIDLHHVQRLEDQRSEGQELEPVVVFYDGEY